jgi:hypothetical protein
MKQYLLFTIILLLLANFVQGETTSSIPQYINYQGMLTNAEGQPLETKEYKLSFSIFNQPTGGETVWGPQIFDGRYGDGRGAKVPVVRGHFNVILGEKDTNGRLIINAFQSKDAYLEITVENNTPVSPRQQILSTPYALQSQVSQTAKSVSGEVKIGDRGTICCNSTEGYIRYNSDNKVLEVCNGEAWKNVTQGCNKKFSSCLEIYEAECSHGDGVYKISPDMNSIFDVYCDMSGGGWTLVLKATGDDELSYDSAYWTNNVLLNENDLTLKAGNSKYNSYNTLKTSRLRGCLDGYCFYQDFDGTKTSREIFSNVTKTISDHPFFGNGAYWSTQPNCKQYGLNNLVGYGKIRFGYSANNENDCVTNDTYIGFGISLSLYHDIEVGSSYLCLDPHCSKGQVRAGANGSLWVK